MINKLIPIVHLIIAFFYSFYAFIFPKNFLYDYLYFGFLICVQLLWIVFNHECPFSYFYKKINYKNYNCGETTTLDDFQELISKTNSKNEKKSLDIGKSVDTIFTIGIILSIIITGYRSKIANIYLIIFVLIILRFTYILFNKAIGWNAKSIFGKYYIYNEKIYYLYHINYIHDEVNMLIALIQISFFIYITYINWKRL